MGEKPYHCDICSKLVSENNTSRREAITTFGNSFSENGVLSIYEHVHTREKLYHGYVCGTSFSHRPDLTVHQGIHTGEKLCQCDISGKLFSPKKPQAFTFGILHPVDMKEITSFRCAFDVFINFY
ncbi:---NA--- [Octopus vulgaris]|uniref:---NA n=1 Tax=Octopus vulgaris TaxID=6645 RepID=A0AA36C0N3_OCTVU|nr:---NA--- [Octopus vulgaris]